MGIGLKPGHPVSSSGFVKPQLEGETALLLGGESGLEVVYSSKEWNQQEQDS